MKITEIPHFVLGKVVKLFSFVWNNISSLLAQIIEILIKRHHAVKCHHIQFFLSIYEYCLDWSGNLSKTCWELGHPVFLKRVEIVMMQSAMYLNNTKH